MIVKLDLKKIARDIGAHLDKLGLDEVEGQCPQCAEDGNIVYLDQHTRYCPVCESDVVWFHSKPWAQEHGNPNEIMRTLKSIKPTTESGIWLFVKLGLPGWRTKDEEASWQKCVSLWGENEMMRVAMYVVNLHVGIPGLSHAVNAARAKFRKGKIDNKAPIVSDEVQDGEGILEL